MVLDFDKSGRLYSGRRFIDIIIISRQAEECFPPLPRRYYAIRSYISGKTRQPRRGRYREASFVGRLLFTIEAPRYRSFQRYASAAFKS